MAAQTETADAGELPVAVSVAVSGAMYLLMVVTFPVGYLVAVLTRALTWPLDRDGRVLHLWTCAWAMFYVYANPLWRVRYSGRDRVPRRGPAVIVANHESHVDILVLFGLYRDFKYVSKESVFKVPFIGWNMRMNHYVALRRGERESVREMMARCDEILAGGGSLAIFPEGTRSRDGRLQPFKDGAFELALRHGATVVPVAIDGTYGSLPKHSRRLKRAMRARVDVLEVIDAREFADVAALREATRERIARHLVG